MWAVLKRLWRGRGHVRPNEQSKPGQQGASASGSDYLRRLREQELSVGAALRRGEPVQRAPGQTASASDRPAPRSSPASGTRQAAARPTSPAPDAPAASRATGDTATAYGVAAATGDAALAYAAGGSVAGGVAGSVVGEAASRAPDD